MGAEDGYMKTTFTIDIELHSDAVERLDYDEEWDDVCDLVGESAKDACMAMGLLTGTGNPKVTVKVVRPEDCI